jgi:hypothetical protein
MCLILQLNDSEKVKFGITIAERFKVRTTGNTAYKQVQKKTIIFKIRRYLDVRILAILCVRIFMFLFNILWMFK